MVDILSQEEIDNLLSTISLSDSNKDLGGAEGNYKESKRPRYVKIYDFKRPDKFSKDHIRTIQIIYEAFARLTSSNLSAQLRTIITVQVASVDQLTYEEFIRALPSPTTIGLIRIDPLKGNSILEIDPRVTFSIIDRLFGGFGSSSNINRELTDIELAVMEGIITRIIVNLREAWGNVLDINPRLERIETNPQFTQTVPPSDMVVLITLEIKINNIEGLANFCIPYITLEPIISKLSAQYWYSSIKKGISSSHFKMLKEQLSLMEIDLTAEIGNTSITIEELITLEKGDVMQLSNHCLGSQLSLKIGSQKKFLCYPGLVGKRIAVQISSVLKNRLNDIYNNMSMEEKN